MREFAKTLAGPNPSTERWEAERRQVQKWLGGQQMFPKSARKVAAALGEPPEVWLSQRRRARDIVERVAQLEARASALEAQLQETTALLQALLGDQSSVQERRGAQ